MPRVSRVVQGLLAMFLLIGGTELLVRIIGTQSYIFPRPSEVWTAMRSQSAGVWIAWWTTLSEALAGLGIALIVSSLLATAIIFLPSVIGRAVNTAGIAVQSTPLLAIAPLLSLWLGQSFASKAAAACIVSFFPILTGWLAGVRSVDPEYLQLLENLGANNWQRARYLFYPSALPYFFGGLRVSMPLALLGAIVAEFVGASEGIGFRILSNSYYVRTAMMFGYVFLAAVTGWALTTIAASWERRVLFWHGQERRV
jgi:NitT/TauT family transport system permease protein